MVSKPLGLFCPSIIRNKFVCVIYNCWILIMHATVVSPSLIVVRKLLGEKAKQEGSMLLENMNPDYLPGFRVVRLSFVYKFLQ